MFVKICGITNFEDAWAAIDMGAQALGFIQAPASPRYIHPEQLQQWIARIPVNIWKVGVFVNESPAKIEWISTQLGLNIAQLHGDETPAHHPQNLQIWRAFRVTPEAPPNREYPADAILLDGPGGGKTFDWKICSTIARPLILAGGLNQHNVREAIAETNPWGVDIASGIESSPGRKDHLRMKQFIEAALSK